MRSIIIRRPRGPINNASPDAVDVEATIHGRDTGKTPDTLKGPAFGAWYAKIHSPTLMWVAVHGQTIRKTLEVEGIDVEGCMHKGEFVAHSIADQTVLNAEQQIALLKVANQKIAEYGLFTVGSLEQVEAYLTRTQRRLGASALLVCDIKETGPKRKFRAAKNVVTTTVMSVVWNFDHRGNIVPRIMVVPVIIQGALITHVSGHNAKFISEGGIGPGATVRIQYIRGLMPIIDEVIGTADATWPDEPYTWDDSLLNIRVPSRKQLVGQ